MFGLPALSAQKNNISDPFIPPFGENPTADHPLALDWILNTILLSSISAFHQTQIFSSGSKGTLCVQDWHCIKENCTKHKRVSSCTLVIILKEQDVLALTLHYEWLIIGCDIMWGCVMWCGRMWHECHVVKSHVRMTCSTHGRWSSKVLPSNFYINASINIIIHIANVWLLYIINNFLQ